MIKVKQLLTIFIPSILLVSFGLFIKITQYRPLFAKPIVNSSNENNLTPIFPEDPILGNKKAPITVVAFEDFACSACKTQAEIIDELLQKFPDKIKFIWKGLSSDSRSPFISKFINDYGYCANKQNKFANFYSFAFANNQNLSDNTLKTIAQEIKLDEKKLSECLSDNATQNYNEKNKQLAISLNIQTTPTFFVNNKQIQMPKSIEDWQLILNQ